MNNKEKKQLDLIDYDYTYEHLSLLNLDNFVDSEIKRAEEKDQSLLISLSDIIPDNSK
jgi:hypothetical protein|tara:strand:+ start:338 stop:511 length:174 start_codon:yes stop_codon:yes gene_type:complete